MPQYVIGPNARAQRVGTATLVPGDAVPDDYVAAIPAGARDRLVRGGVFVPATTGGGETTRSGTLTKEAVLAAVVEYRETEPEHWDGLRAELLKAMNEPASEEPPALSADELIARVQDWAKAHPGAFAPVKKAIYHIKAPSSSAPRKGGS